VLFCIATVSSAVITASRNWFFGVEKGVAANAVAITVLDVIRVIARTAPAFANFFKIMLCMLSKFQINFNGYVATLLCLTYILGGLCQIVVRVDLVYNLQK